MAKKKQKAQGGETKTQRRLWHYLAWAVLAAGWVLVVAAMVSHDPADPPSHFIVRPDAGRPGNWVGQVGAWISYKLYTLVGPGVWVTLAGGLAWLGATAIGRRVSQFSLRLAGLLLMSLAVSAILALMVPGGFTGVVPPEGAGGWLAILINRELAARFNTVGTMVLLVLGFWVGALLAVDQWVLAGPRLLGRGFMALVHIDWPKPVLVGRLSMPGIFSRFGRGRPRVEALPDDTGDAAAALAGTARRRPAPAREEEPIDEEAGGLGGTQSFDPDDYRKPRPAADDADDEQPEPARAAPAGRPRRAAVEAEEDHTAPESPEPPAPANHQDVEDEDDAQDLDDNAVQPAAETPHDAAAAYAAEKAFDPEALRAKIKNMPINFAPRGKPKAAEPPREIDLSGYQFPGLDLLEEPEGSFTAEMEKVVREQAEQLEMALQQYRIEGEVVAIDSGPVITMFEIRLAPGTKVSRLNAISSDIARALKAQNIRIVPNIVGKDTIGVEVPNIKKEKVRLKELMTAHSEATGKMKLPMFLGKDASGNPLIADLTQMPHMLIAGTTGSGKSVCMNSIIMSFLYTKRPDELKLVLVDPKMVEMSLFKDIPHLMCPVVTEMDKASAILEWAVTKMDERYELLAEAGVRDIAGYNALGWEEIKERMQPASEAEEVRIPKKLPYMVFIIDELADLMMTNKEVESFIVRIAQKARAVGIHLILATQRPQANVVTGLIKGNMPCRISFKVASRLDSRIVLDQSGAELLLGQGDMLYLSPRTSKLTRAQGSLVDDLEIRRSVKFLRDLAQQNFEPQLVQIKGPGAGGEDGEDGSGERDELFDEAVRVVLESQRGSVSLLQRRLTIGYSRASRLIEQICEAGIIGAYKGSQAREVMLTLEEWDALKAQAEADADANPAANANDQADAAEAAEERFEAEESPEEDDEDAVPDEFDDEYRH